MGKEKLLFKINGPIEVKGRRKEYIQDIFSKKNQYVRAHSERQARLLFAHRFANILGYEKYAVFIGESEIEIVKQEKEIH